jgi:hypothetical protein
MAFAGKHPQMLRVCSGISGFIELKREDGESGLLKTL